tara:strand:- start:241 stop:573 length:333 start_codon:yes stop_codon:yes gene_type:complete
MNSSAIQEDYLSELEPIPTYKQLMETYDQRWLAEKEKFQSEIRANFHALVQRFARGKQEVYCLSVAGRKFPLYEAAFLELFDSGYAPHIGEKERLAGKAVKRLYITLPSS